MNPIKTWNEFFFKPQTTYVLGLYRIVIGLLIIYSFILWAPHITIFFSDAGVLKASTLQEVIYRDYHTIFHYITSPLGVKLALTLLFMAAFSFTIGFKTRLSAIILFILITSFHERNNLVLNSGDTVLRCMLFFFMFAPSGNSFSVDGLIKHLRQKDPITDILLLKTPWAQRMMQIQVAIIYFVTAYAKSRGELWHGGEAMYYVWGLVDFNKVGVEQWMNYPLLYSTMTFFSLFAEASLPFLLWFKASRPYAVLLGIGLHGWIIGFMTIPVFGILMIVTYIPFFTEEELNHLIEKIRKRSELKKGKIYYDGLCPLCLRSKRIIELLDLFKRTQFIDVRQTLLEGIDKEKQLKEMHLVTPAGNIYSGFKAFRWIALRLPATSWITPMLFIPGVPFVGKKVYAWVAKNRKIAIQCENPETCSMHTIKKSSES